MAKHSNALRGACITVALGLVLGTVSRGQAETSTSSNDAAPEVTPTPPRTAALNMDVAGANGAGTSLVPGIACAAGGSGDNWHYIYAGSQPPGVFGASLPADVRLGVNLHAEPVGLVPIRTYSRGFLLRDQSDVWLSNARGAVRLVLNSGSGACGDSSMSFNGVTTGGAGAWAVAGGNGSYRGMSGSGTFSLTADVAPGADNPFRLTLAGNTTLLQPTLTAGVASAGWGALGKAYVQRIVTVNYRVTNAGPGDAFGVRLVGVIPRTQGVTALLGGVSSRNLGDIAAGESELVSVTYRLTSEPCLAVIVDCTFKADLTFAAPDAFDVPVEPKPTVTVTATAPVLP